LIHPAHFFFGLLNKRRIPAGDLAGLKRPAKAFNAITAIKPNAEIILGHIGTINSSFRNHPAPPEFTSVELLIHH
jgi:hypothetical protein